LVYGCHAALPILTAYKHNERSFLGGRNTLINGYVEMVIRTEVSPFGFMVIQDINCGDSFTKVHSISKLL